jgi:ribosome recycling factor
MIDDVYNEFKAKVDSTTSDLQRDLAKVRTGRANLALLEGIRVDYYGAPTPLNGVASLAVADPRLITVKPWDKSQIGAVEKALKDANIGITPQSDGEVIRLPVPALTEERRKELVKKVRAMAEDHRVAIRNHRRDTNGLLKEFEKSGDISEDDCKRALEKVQKEVDAAIARVDEIVVKKEKEVMEV